MSGHLRTREQYERAKRVVADLELKTKGRPARPKDRERYHAGVDHLLIYEWAEQEVQRRKEKGRKAWWENQQKGAA
jgi:imidazolonepropionase-like amidohydrolase